LRVKVQSHIPDVGPAFTAVQIGRDAKRAITNLSAQVGWCGFEDDGKTVKVNPQTVSLNQYHLAE
jgi:hypothetical protein